MLSASRMKICNTCEIRTSNTCDREKGGCGCPLEKKTRSIHSKCPKSKW